jgi:hypothetical protein
MLIRVLLYILAIFFLVRFIFNFVIPILKVGFRMRRQIKEFQRQHQQPVNPFQQQQAYEQTSSQSSSRQYAGKTNGNTKSPSKSGDYIDFEEIK